MEGRKEVSEAKPIDPLRDLAKTLVQQEVRNVGIAAGSGDAMPVERYPEAAAADLAAVNDAAARVAVEHQVAEQGQRAEWHQRRQLQRVRSQPQLD